MLKMEEWNLKSDSTLKPGELKIHEDLHDHQSRQKPESRQEILATKRGRVEAINIAAEKIGQSFHGNILEVGAGNGWCSAYLCSEFPGISHAHVLEIDRPATERLIPQTMSVFGVDETRYTTVLGSFNQIPRTNHFDFVFAMGSLHHSENLYLTMRSLFKTLNIGGFLIAQEPTISDTTSNSYYDRRLSEKIMFQGLQEVWNHERTDIFYRRCEYLTAALHAGFEVAVVDLENRTEPRSKRSLISQWLKPLSRDPVASVANEKTEPPRPTNLLLIAQKKVENSYVPATRWEDPS